MIAFEKVGNEMKNKGFTLIELLAVIVILAIIALIATPIVLNIIDDAKKESDLRSGEFYLKGLELSIAQATLKGQNTTDGVYNIMSNGNVCLETYDSDKKECKDRDGNPNNNELIVEVKGKVPSLGTIVIENGQIVEKLSTDESKKTELPVEVKGEVPKKGAVEITNGQITDVSLSVNNNAIGQNNAGEISYIEKITDICELKESLATDKITVGDKYEC